MHAIMKFRMRKGDNYHMFCPRENKQSRVYKIGVHFDQQNSSVFPLEVNWNYYTYGTCVIVILANGLLS